MWEGQPHWQLAELPTDTQEQRVEEEWGTDGYDARKHSLFPSFEQHLAGHPCWKTLNQVQEASR